MACAALFDAWFLFVQSIVESSRVESSRVGESNHSGLFTNVPSRIAVLCLIRIGESNHCGFYVVESRRFGRCCDVICT